MSRLVPSDRHDTSPCADIISSILLESRWRLLRLQWNDFVVSHSPPECIRRSDIGSARVSTRSTVFWISFMICWRIAVPPRPILWLGQPYRFLRRWQSLDWWTKTRVTSTGRRVSHSCSVLTQEDWNAFSHVHPARLRLDWTSWRDLRIPYAHVHQCATIPSRWALPWLIQKKTSLLLLGWHSILVVHLYQLEFLITAKGLFLFFLMPVTICYLLHLLHYLLSVRQ